MIERPTDSLLPEVNKLRDKITYLSDKSKTKNSVIQALLKKQKVIQDPGNSKVFNSNTEIQAESKRGTSSVLPKKSVLNVTSAVSKYISTSNIFELLSDNSGRLLEASHITPSEIIHVDPFLEKNDRNVTALMGKPILRPIWIGIT